MKDSRYGSAVIYKNGIPSHKYYQLLDWKDRNLPLYKLIHGNASLDMLDADQLAELYNALNLSKQL